MATKKFIEHHLQVHTLRIELMDGNVLLYSIDANRKEELERWMNSKTDDMMESTHDFISFYVFPDRMVFVRIAAVKRFIFCWDPAINVQNPWQYHNNFDVAGEFKGELSIPPVIIKLHSIDEILTFDESPEDVFLGIDEESFAYPNFLKGGLLSLRDEDGEQNYIPVCNIDCIELERAFIYPKDVWEEMERQRDIDNRQN